MEVHFKWESTCNEMRFMTYGSARSRRRGKAMLPREDDESQTLGHLIIQKHFLTLGKFDMHENEKEYKAHAWLYISLCLSMYTKIDLRLYFYSSNPICRIFSKNSHSLISCFTFIHFSFALMWNRNDGYLKIQAPLLISIYIPNILKVLQHDFYF